MKIKHKCKKCGESYSYGRKIYHNCNHSPTFHGSIFEPRKKAMAWNSRDKTN